MRVLTVCIGNVCRPPLMERLLRDRLPADMTVESAGVMAMAGHPMEPNALAELVRFGGAADDFVARQLTERIVAGADLVLTATAAVKARVLGEAPGALRRTFTLLEFAHLIDQAPADLATAQDVVAWAGANRSRAAGKDVDIVDPMGGPPEVHREAADLIDRATAGIAAAFGREQTASFTD